jgi:hypothetical protein
MAPFPADCSMAIASRYKQNTAHILAFRQHHFSEQDSSLAGSQLWQTSSPAVLRSLHAPPLQPRHAPDFRPAALIPSFILIHDFLAASPAKSLRMRWDILSERQRRKARHQTRSKMMPSFFSNTSTIGTWLHNSCILSPWIATRCTRREKVMPDATPKHGITASLFGAGPPVSRRTADSVEYVCPRSRAVWRRRPVSMGTQGTPNTPDLRRCAAPVCERVMTPMENGK